MQMDFEEILRELNAKVNSLSMDNDKITELIEDAKKKIENNQMFSDVADDIKESIEMIMAWKNGKYKDLSQNTVNLLIGGLIFIVNPLGIVPKFLKRIPLAEVMVMVYILKKIKEELEQYRIWKNDNQDINDNTKESEIIYIEL